MVKKALIFVMVSSFILFPSSTPAAVTLSVGNGTENHFKGSHDNPREVSLDNPVERVKRVQVSIAEDSGANDDLVIDSCETTSRTFGFSCTALEVSGFAVIVLDSPSGCRLIDQGTGPIFTLKYKVKGTAPAGPCRSLDPQNISILDEFDNSLQVTPASGQFCLASCSTDPECDDLLYCNGTETCSGGVCLHTGDPCPGTECNTCQEDTDSCFDPLGTICTTDSLFCTGDEICNGSGSCMSAGDPCPLTTTCIEDVGGYLCGCDLQSDCDDGLFCNGDDFCFIGDVCAHTGDPCPAPFQCDEDRDRCVCCTDADCDNANACTDDVCDVDSGYCINTNNTASCDDGLFCNGVDTCDGCGDCTPSGNPCTSPDACYEDADLCSAGQVTLKVNNGSGDLGAANRLVLVQLENSTDLVNGVQMKVCDENDYLTISNCLPRDRAATAGFSCASNELPDGCASVFLIINQLTPLPIPTGSGFIIELFYNVKGADEADTVGVALDPQEVLVIDDSDPAVELAVALESGVFGIWCSQDADCDNGSACTNDSCSGNLCTHAVSGASSCDDGLFCTVTDSCVSGQCIGTGDPCIEYEECNELNDVCDACVDDYDCDDVLDAFDNCLETPNGPGRGTCATGGICVDHCDCGEPNGYCSMAQEDSFPPVGNGIGDACECEANFDCDSDVDGTDAQQFKTDFGRSTFFNPCTSGAPCKGDFDCDGDVDGTDAQKFKEDFGRSPFFNPCPICVVGDWCIY